MDLFVVPTIGFDLLYPLVIVRLDRRDLVWINVTTRWRSGLHVRSPRLFLGTWPSGYMIRDRDRVYGTVVTRRLRAMGIRDKPIAPASPWQNGFSERLIGSIRGECLDHIIVLGEVHLHRILKSYARYYNETRTHLVLDKDAPLSRTVKRAGRILPPNPRRIAPRICSDLIFDRHSGSSVFGAGGAATRSCSRSRTPARSANSRIPAHPWLLPGCAGTIQSELHRRCPAWRHRSLGLCRNRRWSRCCRVPVLSQGLYLQAVLDDEDEAIRNGAQGVPYFLYDGEYAVSGAQSSQAFLQTLRAVKEKERLDADGPTCGIEGCGNN